MPMLLWRRLLHGVCRSFARPDWEQALGVDWTERIMTTTVSDDFHEKQGRSTGRWVVRDGVGKLAVYLKRHYRLPWWRGVLATLFPTRAWAPALQERDNLIWAARHGLSVPAPVAAAEYTGPWFRLQSVLAVEELYEMLPLHQAIPLAAQRLAPDCFRQWKRQLAEELAHMARALHQRSRYHKDLYLCHFFLPRSDIDTWDPSRRHSLRGHLHMIDLHRLRHHPLTWLLWQWKDLAQLLYSSECPGVEPRDRVRFWRIYRGNTPRTCWTRWAEWFIRLKWLRYRDHNRKRALRFAHESAQKKEAA